MNRIQSDVESQKAVLMGNKESVLFVYMINCIVCILFLIQGILMWRAAKPTVEMIEYLKKGGVDNVPADLKQHTQVEAFLVQRQKFKYCIFVSFINTILIFLSTFLSVIIAFDTFQKEEKILVMQMKTQLEGKAYGDDMTKLNNGEEVN